jgi:dienelactone hydrolase
MVRFSMPISEQAVSYRDLDTPLTGRLCWNPALPGQRPGILLVHGGAGLDEHARDQARRYASLGYVVLACDMLGDGVAGERERVVACLTSLRDDPDALVRRAMAGLAVLADSAHADGRFAAVGFCFGGMTVLALARSGQQLAGVISMHGSLTTRAPARAGAIAARVLVCHGAADPHVPLADVTAFAEEMDAAGANWDLVMYGGVQHGFTHSRAVPGAVPGVAYDVRADKKSLAEAKLFLAEIFAA